MRGARGRIVRGPAAPCAASRSLRPALSMRQFLLGAAMLALFQSPALAQPSPTPAEREVRAVVDLLFDGMRTRDTAAMRSTFHEKAVLMTTGTRNGEPFVGETDLGEFLTMIAKAPPADTLNETLYATEVRIDGNLAMVWTGYDFHVNSRFSHCGVDAFTLARTAAGWKIISIADTRRREGCGK